MERIVGTRRQNAEGKPPRCGEDSSLLADTPMRPTPQSGTHGRRSWNRMLKTYQPRAVFGVGAFLCLLVIRLGNVKN